MPPAGAGGIAERLSPGQDALGAASDGAASDGASTDGAASDGAESVGVVVDDGLLQPATAPRTDADNASASRIRLIMTWGSSVAMAPDWHRVWGAGCGTTGGRVGHGERR
jgi:hypothetical protein